MMVGTRKISADQPPYIIAELGVNHDGSLGVAMQLVDHAKRAGADAIKLQWFEARKLLSKQAALATYQADAGERDPYAMLDRLQLDAKAMAKLVDHAHANDLHAIVTVFSVELVAEAAALPWDAYKLASPDVVNRPLIDAIRTIGKPMLLSTGAATPEEVECASEWMESHPFVFMQCVSSYPTPEDAAALGGIVALAQQFPDAPGVGYSDHTAAIDTGALAVACGACVLEKHMTHDVKAAGPDHAASLSPDAFAKYVQAAHRAFRMVGPIDKTVLDIEREVRSLSRQSVTTTRDLPAGHTLTADDLTLKRPGTGLPAATISICVGCTLTRAVEADTQLAEADLT